MCVSLHICLYVCTVCIHTQHGWTYVSSIHRSCSSLSNSQFEMAVFYLNIFSWWMVFEIYPSRCWIRYQITCAVGLPKTCRCLSADRLTITCVQNWRWLLLFSFTCSGAWVIQKTAPKNSYRHNGATTSFNCNRSTMSITNRSVCRQAGEEPRLWPTQL